RCDGLVECHHLLLLTCLVIGETLAQLLDFGLQQLHLAHRVIGFVRKREEEQLDAQRQQQNGQPEITQNLIKKLKHKKNWLGQEIEPAKINRTIEQRYPRVLVSVEEIDLLSTGKETCRRLDHAIGCDGDLLAQKVGLVTRDTVVDGMGEPRLYRLVLRRDQRCQPVLVGKA